MVVLEIAASILLFIGIVAILVLVAALVGMGKDKLKRHFPKVFKVFDAVFIVFLVLLAIAMFLLLPLVIGDIIFSWQWFEAGVE